MINEEKNIPKIRFSGFDEKWDNKKLGNYLSIPIKIKADIKSSNDLMTLKLNLGGISLGTNRETLNLGSTNYYVRKSGQLLYGKQNFFNGSIAIIPPELDNKSTSSDVPSLNISNIITNFIYIYISRHDYWKRKEANASGTGSKRIHEDTLLSFSIKVPNKIEQEKIGNLFENMDKLIKIYQRKLEYLKLMKKALLQKMFPKNNEEIPAIRFKGYTYAWEKHLFGDQYNKVIEKNDLSFGADKIISVANMYYKNDESKSSDSYMKTYNIFRVGDIAFEGHKNKSFSYGRFVENTLGDGIVSHVFDVFRPKVVYDLQYWKYAIHNENILGPILNRVTTQATMMNNLVAKDFLKQKINVPNISEQQKIGELFESLDKKIVVHQRKYENLKLMKKALLQKMFV